MAGVFQERGKNLCLVSCLGDTLGIGLFGSSLLLPLSLKQILLVFSMLSRKGIILRLFQFFEGWNEFVQLIDNRNDLRKERKRFDLVGFEGWQSGIVLLRFECFKTSLKVRISQFFG